MHDFFFNMLFVSLVHWRRVNKDNVTLRSKVKVERREALGAWFD